MTKNLIKKHDELFKSALSDLSIASEFLNAYLDVDIRSNCDFSTFTVEPGSFVSEELKDSASDILFKVKFNNSDDFAYLYLLVEHQSSPDELMPLRVIEYQIS